MTENRLTEEQERALADYEALIRDSMPEFDEDRLRELLSAARRYMLDPSSLAREIEASMRAAAGDDHYDLTKLSVDALRIASKESDRSAAIVSGAIIERWVELAIRKHLNQAGKRRKRGDSLFSPSGPLGAFAVKIDLGALLDLYGEAAWRALVTIKDIRNAFAHDLTISSFEDQRIRDLAMSLSYWEHFRTEDEEFIRIMIGNRRNETKGGAGYRKSEDPFASPRRRFEITCNTFQNALGDLVIEGTGRSPALFLPAEIDEPRG